jgi:SAM-dependent methyltransferase
MNAFSRLISVVGAKQLMRFRRARIWGWEGILRGHYMTRALQTLLSVGVLDAMRGDTWIDPREYAAASALDPDVLAALCEYLYERRVLRRDGRRYTLDDDGRFFIETDLLRGWFVLSHGYEPVLGGLEALARREIRYGRDVVRDGEKVAVGSGLASAGFYFPLAADIIRQQKCRTVLDIGCGDATFLRFVCTALPGVRGVGIDLSPDAIERGRRSNSEQGFGDRITLAAGDATDCAALRALSGDVDAATSFFVLHEFVAHDGDVARLCSFLRHFRESLPGVTLIIVETIRPSAEAMRSQPGPAIEYFLFHDLSLQVPIGRESWKSTLKEAGYTSIHEWPLPWARSAIYTVR